MKDIVMTRRRAVLTALGAAVSVPSNAVPLDELASLSLTEARGLVQSGAVSPLELVDACYKSIVSLNPKLNAYITVDIEGARKQARHAEQVDRTKRGILHGIPIGLKDNINTAGMKTTAASGVLAHNIPSRDAYVVQQLKAAGAIILGKHNLHEFAHGTTSAISYFGAVHNPWNLAYSAGGSSGGSAAAIATGMCFGAVGTDTGGSVRIPAACCGVVGFKPTFGLVRTSGVIPEVQSMDHVGPICRTVRDVAYMLSGIMANGSGVLATHAPFRELDDDIARLRVGVPAGILDKTADDHRAAFEAAIEVLRGLTTGIREVQLPKVPDSVEFVFGAEDYRNHRHALRSKGSRYQPGTREDLLEGARITPAEYAIGVEQVQKLRQDILKKFSYVDVLALPTLRSGPLLLSDCKKPFDGEAYTSDFNVYGIPTISIPCGFTKLGLPVGFQVAGPPGFDNRVLAVADRYQRATDWHKRRPEA